MTFYKRTYNVVIMVMTFILVFTLISLVQYNNKLVLRQRISNQYYTDEAIALQGDFSKNEIKDIAELNSFFLNKGLILYKLVNPVEDIRVVLSTKQFIHPPLTKGRFFSIEDFFGKHNYAVVGGHFLTQLQKVEDKNYYEYNGILYEVIGIFGNNEISRLDYMVFLSANNTNIHMEGLYVIDGNKKSDINYFLKKQSILSNVEIIDKEFVNARRILGLRNSTSIIIIMILIIVSLSYIIITIYWIKKRYMEFFVRRLWGHEVRLVLLSFLMDLFKLNAIGIGFGFIFFTMMKNDKLFSSSIVLGSLGILVFVSGINTTLMIFSFFNKINCPIYDKIR